MRCRDDGGLRLDMMPAAEHSSFAASTPGIDAPDSNTQTQAPLQPHTWRVEHDGKFRSHSRGQSQKEKSKYNEILNKMDSSVLTQNIYLYIV